MKLGDPMKKKINYVLCQQTLMDKLIPSFSKQIDELIAQKDKSNQNILIIDDTEPFNPEHIGNLAQYHINANQIDFKIQGTITLKQLVNGIPIPIFLRDLKGQFIGCNPSFTNFMGLSEDELIGKTVYDVVPQDEAEEYNHRDQELIENPHIQIYEGKITQKCGITKDVIFRKTILLDEKNEGSAIVGVIVDISKRKLMEKSNWEYRNKLEEMVLDRTAHLTKSNQQLKNEIELRRHSENALKDSEELLRTIFNSTYDGIIIHEIAGKILDANDTVCDLFKLEKSKLLSYSLLDEFSASNDSYNDIVRYWLKSELGEKCFFEWKAKSPTDENEIHTELFMQKIVIADQPVMLINIRDISERKAVEKLLLQEHNKVKIALKHEMLLSTIATILNSTENFFDVLDNLLSIIEKTMHLTLSGFYAFCPDYIGDFKKKIPFFDITEPSHYKSLFANLKESIKLNKSLYYTQMDDMTDSLRNFLKENQISAFAMMPLKISGEVKGVIHFQSDCSQDWTSKHYSIFNTIANMIANAWERYILKEQRLTAEKQTIETVKLLESSSKLASIGVMAAGITHEINQPLNAIKIMADGILFWNKRNIGLLPDTFIQKIQKITQAVNRIDSIIKHMRSFWVPNAKRPDEYFSLNEAVNNAIDMIQSQISAHGIILKTSFYDQELKLKGDMIHAEQIVMNLCLNAMHALDQESKNEKIIIIHTLKSEQKIILKVEDNGPGLPESFSEKLFDPFFSTKKPGEGMGLGLAIVKQFLDNMNAEIDVRNREEGGAQFSISFPALDN